MRDPGLGRPTTMLSRTYSGAGDDFIRFGTTHRGEFPSPVNHAGFLCRDRATLIEQTAPKVRRTDLLQQYDDEDHWFILLEHVGVTEFRHTVMEKKAETFLGQPYGWAAIVKDGLDGLLGKVFGRNVFLFRRLRLPFIKNTALWVVCSVFDCLLHDFVGLFYCTIQTRIVRQGLRWKRVREQVRLDPKCATPDDLWDDAFYVRPDMFIVRGEGGKRPDDLPWTCAERIEADLARAT